MIRRLKGYCITCKKYVIIPVDKAEIKKDGVNYHRYTCPECDCENCLVLGKAPKLGDEISMISDLYGSAEIGSINVMYNCKIKDEELHLTSRWVSGKWFVTLSNKLQHDKPIPTEFSGYELLPTVKRLIDEIKGVI